MSQAPRNPSTVPLAAASGLALSGLAVAMGVGGDGWPARLVLALVILALLAAAFWLASRAVGERLRHARALAQHDLRATAAEERLRIARDVHDLVTQSTGAITVRAAVARRLADRDPEEPVRALADIEELSRRTSDELRRVVAALRDGDPPVIQGAASPRPDVGPSLADDLGRVAERIRRHGVAYDLTVEPGPELSADLRSTIQLVVAEATGNALRHAHPGHVDIRLRRPGGRVELSVRNDGCGGGRPATSGHGLAGIRERARARGGEMTAARIGDDFVLTVTVPSAATGEGAPRD